jgi:hypothetical protein
MTDHEAGLLGTEGPDRRRSVRRQCPSCLPENMLPAGFGVRCSVSIDCRRLGARRTASALFTNPEAAQAGIFRCWSLRSDATDVVARQQRSISIARFHGIGRMETLAFSKPPIGMRDAESLIARTWSQLHYCTAKGGDAVVRFRGGTDDAQGGKAAGTYQQVDQQIVLFGELPGGADFDRLGSDATRPRSGALLINQVPSRLQGRITFKGGIENGYYHQSVCKSAELE